MAAIDRNILRLGAYEILYCPDVPTKVAINESLELAKRYSTGQSSRFVNGILDRLLSAEAASQKPATGSETETETETGAETKGETETTAGPEAEGPRPPP